MDCGAQLRRLTSAHLRATIAQLRLLQSVVFEVVLILVKEARQVAAETLVGGSVQRTASLSSARTARIASRLAVLAALQTLVGCAADYYWQAMSGQVKLLREREPVAELLQRPNLDPALRQRLLLANEVLSFARDELQLPNNGSYTSYYDIGGPYIVWNVMAAPEFELEAKTWCFPVAGCVAYRGYFEQARAERYAAELASDGYDVYVGGVAAYSTLGRFKDPILSSMLSYSDDRFTGLLIHELAHQQLYLKGDTAFNEGFATFVEQAGLARWRLAQGLSAGESSAALKAQHLVVLQLLEETRAQLVSLYAAGGSDQHRRQAKAAIIDRLRQHYQRLMNDYLSRGLTTRPYEGLIMGELNNASLLAVATYQDLVPAFAVLEEDCEQVLPCVYARAEQLAELGAEQRAAAVKSLLQRAERAARDAP